MAKHLLTTSVGSFPKPNKLLTARTQFRRGQISAEQLRESEEDATRQVINLQEALNLDIFVHGEMERGDMVAYFAEHWQGFSESLPVRSYGNRYYKKPIVENVVSLGDSVGLTVVSWEKASRLTSHPVKGMLTGPYTICDWSFNAYYPDRRSLVMDLAQLVHEEAVALEKAGAKYIQIDEPAISTRPDELDLAIEAMAIVTQGLQAKTISHICYGDFETILPGLYDLPVDQLDLEAANQHFALLDLLARYPWPKSKELALGVVDVHSHRIESVDEVKAGIRRALEIIPLDQLLIDPDCGLKTRTWDEAEQKLRVMMTAVEEIRDEDGLQ
ncbi:MAG: methionine synthase [Firmicutes bacterium]|jgi:5-methyltetrahydropteroyltriglutamate--homocysteine methyltransferase|uniref:Methionine synthase n=1 Tax=Sulfobacillus benefaciens TaxID=453960 RepID=A0A2T2XAI0_9FIRM|nr:methionine synthase [Bacillota bacterium]MCL5014363.1 methionine synthase [Bacillota bacterium]PSR31468.1 MAG: methionine synthase [Sulfobacillus benefaciens]HBQ96114.1 methionine synthase [Sulfobacillus sp.]